MASGQQWPLPWPSVVLKYTHWLDVRIGCNHYKSKTGCRIHAMDVRDKDSIYRLFSAPKIDILVNNAGLGRGYDTLSETQPRGY